MQSVKMYMYIIQIFINYKNLLYNKSKKADNNIVILFNKKTEGLYL